jgi:hypothetical protein
MTLIAAFNLSDKLYLFADSRITKAKERYDDVLKFLPLLQSRFCGISIVLSAVLNKEMKSRIIL